MGARSVDPDPRFFVREIALGSLRAFLPSGGRLLLDVHRDFRRPRWAGHGGRSVGRIFRLLWADVGRYRSVPRRRASGDRHVPGFREAVCPRCRANSWVVLLDRLCWQDAVRRDGLRCLPFYAKAVRSLHVLWVVQVPVAQYPTIFRCAACGVRYSVCSSGVG